MVNPEIELFSVTVLDVFSVLSGVVAPGHPVKTSIMGSKLPLPLTVMNCVVEIA